MKTKHIIVSGKVQGVFFRKHTKQSAIENSIKGWVKNLPNESVEIMAQGNKEDLEKFIDYCSKGPLNANVQHVKISETEAEPFMNFEIKKH